jgi:uncharacterized membrane protein YgcG
MKLPFKWLALCFLLISLPALSAEVIHHFHADIAVQIDGSIRVTETIVVTAEGKQIKRGIYREFPTRYKDKLGNTVNTSFDIVSVLRDGYKESFHTEKMANGTRLYIGKSNVFLNKGQYTYQIHYISQYQLGFFENQDELYWNVTGNDWSFPIQHASTRIVLPQHFSPSEITTASYQGRMGSTESALQTAIFDNAVEFTSSRTLRSGEGLTVAVAWPKGHVYRPNFFDKMQRLAANNASILAASIGFLLAFLYYLIIWHAIGRDPKKGTIIALYHPVESLSAAAHRYILNMGYDNKAFTACLISLAVKGFITIEQKKSPTITRTRLAPNHLLNESEKRILIDLFLSSDTLTFTQVNHERIRAVIELHQGLLNKEYLYKKFHTNFAFLIPAILISIIAGIFCIILEPNFIAIIIAAPTAIVLHLIFFYLLKAPTLAGRKVMDNIEGFKEYLQVGEKDNIAKQEAPTMSTALFEEYLPYAIALDVENAWCERLHKEVLMATGGDDYQPQWHSGIRFNASTFGSSLSSLNNSISSASSPPGSSSGSGGGGSSGGGGGGGGGGGW